MRRQLCPLSGSEASCPLWWQFADNPHRHHMEQSAFELSVATYAFKRYVLNTGPCDIMSTQHYSKSITARARHQKGVNASSFYNAEIAEHALAVTPTLTICKHCHSDSNEQP